MLDYRVELARSWKSKAPQGVTLRGCSRCGRLQSRYRRGLHFGLIAIASCRTSIMMPERQSIITVKYSLQKPEARLDGPENLIHHVIVEAVGQVFPPAGCVLSKFRQEQAVKRNRVDEVALCPGIALVEVLHDRNPVDENVVRPHGAWLGSAERHNSDKRCVVGFRRADGNHRAALDDFREPVSAEIADENLTNRILELNHWGTPLRRLRLLIGNYRQGGRDA